MRDTRADIYTTANIVSKYFLSKEKMTNKKLQKLVYYAYSWSLVLLNYPEANQEEFTRLFDEPIEAWVHGPVIPSLYHEYKKYGWNEIPKKEFKDNLDCEVTNVLDQVWNVYSKFTANELEEITHNEDPWKIARRGFGMFEPSNSVISDESIYEYYLKVLKDSVDE